VVFKLFSKLKGESSKPSSNSCLTCVNIIQETPDVKTFQFTTNDESLFEFKPGQFVTIQVEVGGEKHLRSYTIASSPIKKDSIELTIKRDLTGAVSPWLFENMQPGAELEYRGPSGQFNCIDTESNKVLLISAGSGITPVMSMTRYWCDKKVDKDIVFLNWATSVEDIIFKKELESLDQDNNNLKLEIICTRPETSENWSGHQGRINTSGLIELAPDLKERTVFCCGPDGFMQQVQTCLQEAGFDLNNYYDETFDPGGKKKAKLAQESGPEKKPQSEHQAQQKPSSTEGVEQAETFQLTLSRSGKVIQMGKDEILLERLEQEGIAVDSACRGGDCGTCEVKKLSGDIESENDLGLFDDSKQAGYILTCTTRLKSDVELDI
jgi:ferredoxin-NADP reductase